MFLAVGCTPMAHPNRLRVAPFQTVAAKPRGGVQVFQQAVDIKRPYKVIALLTTDADAADEAAVLKAMLERAADLGADGLLFGAPKSGEKDGKLEIKIGWGALRLTRETDKGSRRIYRAEAIMFMQ
jgi:hypothetical protein